MAVLTEAKLISPPDYFTITLPWTHTFGLDPHVALDRAGCCFTTSSAGQAACERRSLSRRYEIVL